MTNQQPGGELAAIKRRPVGKGAWRMTITELIESERASLQELRAIGNRHPNDVETQRHLVRALLEAADRMNKLMELQYYRDAGADKGDEPC